MTRYIKNIIGTVICIFLLDTGCSLRGGTRNYIKVDTQNLMTPTGAPVLTPTMEPTPVEKIVPYRKDSLWNTPIDPNARYDLHSEEMIANLVLANEGVLITPDTYNYPVYFADDNTPRWTIPCTRYKCTIANSDQDVIRTDMVENVPIPPSAQPGPDDDARMIIIDRVTYTEYDLWRAERTESGWTVGNASIYNILWNGTPVLHSSRGSGTPSYAGLIRPWEIHQGRIEHTLAFGYTEPALDKCVFPASKTDGDSTLPFAIPEGARLQLDPSLTEADFEKWGLNRTGKIIARALQEFGMILVDHSGSFKIYLEDLTINPYNTEDWTDPGLDLTKDTISNIPYTAFRVLELPAGYWQDSPQAVYHGKCLTFPGQP